MHSTLAVLARAEAWLGYHCPPLLAKLLEQLEPEALAAVLSAIPVSAPSWYWPSHVLLQALACSSDLMDSTVSRQQVVCWMQQHQDVLAALQQEADHHHQMMQQEGESMEDRAMHARVYETAQQELQDQSAHGNATACLALLCSSTSTAPALCSMQQLLPQLLHLLNSTMQRCGGTQLHSTAVEHGDGHFGAAADSCSCSGCCVTRWMHSFDGVQQFSLYRPVFQQHGWDDGVLLSSTSVATLSLPLEEGLGTDDGYLEECYHLVMASNMLQGLEHFLGIIKQQLQEQTGAQAGSSSAGAAATSQQSCCAWLEAAVGASCAVTTTDSTSDDWQQPKTLLEALLACRTLASCSLSEAALGCTVQLLEASLLCGSSAAAPMTAGQCTPAGSWRHCRAWASLCTAAASRRLQQHRRPCCQQRQQLLQLDLRQQRCQQAWRQRPQQVRRMPPVHG